MRSAGTPSLSQSRTGASEGAGIRIRHGRAQDLSAYYNKMDSIFQHLNRDDVPSGLLGDYGIDFVDFTAFNGVPSDTNYVTLATWNMLYVSIFSARFGTNATLSVPDSVMAAIEAADKNAVAIMHFDYQALNPEALDLGYVTIVDEHNKTKKQYLCKKTF